MKVAKNVLNRIHVQRLLLAVALSGVSLTAGAASSFPAFMAKISGRGTTVGAASDGTLIVTKGAGLTAGGGWTNAGNYGVAAGASGVKIGGTGTVSAGGKMVPVEIGGSLSKEAIAGAIAGCATGGIVGCALGTLTPLAIGWLALSGTRPSSGPGGGFEGVGTLGLWKSIAFPQCAGRDPQIVAACASQASDPTNPTTGPCAVSERITPLFEEWLCRGWRGNLQKQEDQSPTWNPVTPAEVVDALVAAGPPPPMIVPELEKAGVDWNKIWPGYDVDTPDGSMRKPKLIGPAEILGEKTTTTNPDGSTTVKQSRTPLTYEGSKVTAGPTTTTETTTNADGTPRGTTTTVTEPGTEAEKPEEKESETQCDKYPETLGCAQLDTPEGEIPKENKTVTFQAEDVLGGGACPANVTASFATLGGQSATIVDWQTFCGMALPLRGLVIALASIMAFFIIMPGGVRE